MEKQFRYVIESLRERAITDGVHLSWAIKWKDKNLETRQKDRLEQLQDAMNYLSTAKFE